MDCNVRTRPRQRLLPPGASPPSPLSTSERRMLPDSELPSNSEGDNPAGLVALAAATAALDLRGTYTVREASEILQLTTNTIYDLIHRDVIP